MGKFYRFVRFLVNLLLPLVWKVRIENRGGLTREGAYIISCNHNYWIDPVIVAMKSKRQVHFLGKRELFENRFMRAFYNGLGAIPITRGATDMSGVKAVLKTLKNGDVLGIFPEGTRTGGTHYNPMQDGAAFFALRTGCPIVPCGIAGSSKFRGRMQLCVGQPIYMDIPEGEKPDNEDTQRLTEKLGEEIIRLSERAKGML